MPAWLSELLKALYQVVTWYVVFRGWQFVRNDNDRREKRRELRSSIDSITKDIEALEVKAHEYYLVSVKNSEDQKEGQADQADRIAMMEVQLIRGKTSLEGRIERLREMTNSFSDKDLLNKFTNELTGGDFQTKERKALLPNDRKLQNISYSALFLINYLEKEYRDKETNYLDSVRKFR